MLAIRSNEPNRAGQRGQAYCGSPRVTLGRTRPLLNDAGRGSTRAREASTGAADVVGLVDEAQIGTHGR